MVEIVNYSRCDQQEWPLQAQPTLTRKRGSEICNALPLFWSIRGNIGR